MRYYNHKKDLKKSASSIYEEISHVTLFLFIALFTRTKPSRKFIGRHKQFNLQPPNDFST